MSDLIPLHLMWMRAGGRSPRTIHDRGRLLEHADRVLPYGIEEAHTDEWSSYFANDRWQPWTRHTYFNHGWGFYQWAVPDYLTLNPLSALIRPPEGDRLPNPATDEELAHALAVLPDQPWRMAVLLAAYAALRCCEIVTVRREDCTAEWLRVRGKGGKLATVPMAPQLWDAIRTRPSGLLVTGARGRPLTAQMITQMQRRVWDRIGQPNQRLHRFRHWCGTQIQRQTGNIRITQQVLRHSSVRSTEGYTLVTPAELQTAIALLGAPASH